jgi:MOSC domain-containing protein YiiM
VTHLFLSPGRKMPLRSVQEARAVARWGLEGDRHYNEDHPRQILLVEAETLARFDLAPGALRENIVVEGVALHLEPPGRRLRVGGAVLELTGPCEPCAYLETIRAGLQEAIDGRRGVLARAVESGAIRVGDAVERLAGHVVDRGGG